MSKSGRVAPPEESHVCDLREGPQPVVRRCPPEPKIARGSSSCAALLSVAQLFALIVWLAGCAPPAIVAPAERVVSQLFDAVRAQDDEAVRRLISTRFRSGDSADFWDQMQRDRRTKLGQLKNVRTRTLRAETAVGSCGRGLVVKVVCDTEYEKAKAVESFTIGSQGSGSDLVVLEYTLSSPALLPQGYPTSSGSR